MKLIGVSGSLRAGSYNSALLRAAVGLMPAGFTLEIATIAGIPLYDGDAETKDGLPPAVTALKAAIAGADGVILVTPEYNSGIPGVFKNAIDWTSRPSSDIARVWGGRPTAIIGASQGGFGTVLSQNAWLSVLHKLGAAQWHGAQLLVSRAQGVFTADGELADDKIRAQLAAYLAAFAASLAAK